MNIGGLLIGAVATLFHAVINVVEFLMERPDPLPTARSAAQSDDADAIDGFAFAALRASAERSAARRRDAAPGRFCAGRHRGEPQLGITCPACYTHPLRYGSYTWRIGGGRADADFQAFLTDLGAAGRATLDEPASFSASTTRLLALWQRRPRVRGCGKTWLPGPPSTPVSWPPACRSALGV